MSHPKTYWKKNLRYLFLLLSLWFLISFGAGIIWVEQLNEFKVGGLPLGFWFAQQGAIYGFILIIFLYIYLMNRLDQKHGYND